MLGNTTSHSGVRLFLALTVGTLLILSALSATAQTVTYYQTGEEFVGPLAGWKNVKTDYGAHGDGSTDDAAAITTALQALRTSNTNTWNTLYFPAGTYAINSTIYNETALATPRVNGDDFSGVQIIGEDPANTVIMWNGPTGQSMFILDGWYLKISRLTLDGKSKALDGLVRWGSFSTGSEISDMIFKDIPGNGINNGGAVNGTIWGIQGGQAEQMILRCKFIRCGTGIANPNMNSLDEWVWNCLFEDCGYGMNSGGFQSYGNVFLRSTKPDHGASIQPVSIVNNVSVGSKNFAYNYPATMMRGNKLYNVDSIRAIYDAFSFLDNTVLCKSSTPVVRLCTDPGHEAAYLLAGNNYSSSTAVTVGAPSSSFITRFDEHVVSASSIPVPSTVELPATPPKTNRTVFEVRKGTGDDATELQYQIYMACTSSTAGVKPVVHIPKGGLSLKRPVYVPPRKAITIVGEGVGMGGSSIGAISSVKGTFVLLAPSKVILRDVGISGTPGLIIYVNDDMPGGRIISKGSSFSGQSPDLRSGTNILIDSVENTDITFEATNCQRFDKGVVVRGGPVLSGGGTTSGQVAFFGGASAHGNAMFNVQNKGKCFAEGFWYEGGITWTASFLNLTSAAAFQSSGTLDICSMFWATDISSRPTVLLDGFKGKFTFLNNKFAVYGGLITYWTLKNLTDAKVLCAQNIFSYGTNQTLWRDSTSPAADAAAMGNGTGAGPGTLFPPIYKQVSNSMPDTNWIGSQIASIRSVRIAKEVPIADSNLTDVKLIRLSVGTSPSQIAMRIAVKSSIPPAVLPFIAQSLTNSNKYGSQIVMPGKRISIAQGVTKVAAYDLHGRLILDKSIMSNNDALAVTKEVQLLGRKSAVMVKMY